MLQLVNKTFIFQGSFLSPTALEPGMGDYKMGSVCVRECVRVLLCHADFSKTMTVTHFLSKKCPNQFSYPEIFFFGFVDFHLKLSEL